MVLVVPIFLPPEPSSHPRSRADGATFRMESTEDSAACSPENGCQAKCQGWAKKTTHGFNRVGSSPPQQLNIWNFENRLD